jgi:hypothetical protein
MRQANLEISSAELEEIFLIIALNDDTVASNSKMDSILAKSNDIYCKM